MDLTRDQLYNLYSGVEEALLEKKKRFRRGFFLFFFSAAKIFELIFFNDQAMGHSELKLKS